MGVSKECLRVWLCVYVTKNGTTVVCTVSISSPYLLYVSNITSHYFHYYYYYYYYSIVKYVNDEH